MWIVVRAQRSCYEAMTSGLTRIYFQIGLESDPMQIQSIELSPDPPKPGQDLTVKVKGTVTETIDVRFLSLLMVMCLQRLTIRCRREHMPTSP